MPSQKKNPTFAIVACEKSSDNLGAELITGLKRIFPRANFIGVGGSAMRRAGISSLFDMQELTAHGLVEVIPKLPKLFSLRQKIIDKVLSAKSDIFIGIDAPDFNLGLARKFRQHKIKTVHYVSPTVWYWRPKRIVKVSQAADLLLCIFPFEPKLYRELGKKYNVKVNAVYIGHPLADKIPLSCNKNKARQELLGLRGLPRDSKCLAFMPGSRATEIKNLGQVFAQTAKLCLAQAEAEADGKEAKLHCLFSAVNKDVAKQLKDLLQQNNLPKDKYSVVTGKSHKLIEAADAVLLASGTTSLEVMLFKKPMIVTYIINPITTLIGKAMRTSKHFALPNILLGREVVPELLNEEVRAEDLAERLMRKLRQEDQAAKQAKSFLAMHKKLRMNSSQRAAELVAKLV